MDDVISRLSEIRSQYNCFNESEEPYYRALSAVIKMLSEQADGDTISRQAVTDTVRTIILGFFSDKDGAMTDTEKTLLSVNKAICDGVRALPSAQPEIIRCCKCGFWDRDTLRHQFNDFRDWNEAECMILAERDPYHEMDRYTEADDYCSMAERRTDG